MPKRKEVYRNPNILKYPQLTQRSAVLRSLFFINDEYSQVIMDVSNFSLRYNDNLEGHVTLVGIDRDPVPMATFQHGYFSESIMINNSPTMLLLVDYQTIANSDTSDYMVVLIPYPPIYIFRLFVWGRGVAELPELLRDQLVEYLEENGTFYKLEDLPALLQQL